MGNEHESRIMTMATGVEASYGGGAAAAVPGSATHLFRNTTPLRVDRQKRNLDELRLTKTQSADLIGRELFEITPGLLYMGHNFLGQAGFRLDPILRMCGMAATVAGGGSTLTYKNRSTGYESGAVNLWMNNEAGDDCVLHALTGCFGTFTMGAGAGEEIVVNPTLRGVYTAPTLVGSAVSETLPANTAEVLESIGLTITPVGGSAITPRVLSFEYNHGAQTREQRDANQAKGFKGLKPGTRQNTLRVVIAMDDEDYVNSFAADASSGLLHDIDFTTGSVAGRRMQLTLRGQLELELGDDDGDRILTATYTAKHGTAEGETLLVFT